MKFTTKINAIRSSCTIVFAVLISLGALLSTPLPGGVPVTIQNFFVATGALLLGASQGAGAVGLFLLFGALEFPVFACQKSGLSVIVGQTGGYLWGYFIGAFIAGFIVGSPINKKADKRDWIKLILAAFAVYAIPYFFGIPWYTHYNNISGNQMSFKQILQNTFFPFILGDLVKLFITVIISAVLRPHIAKLLYPNDELEAEIIANKIEKRNKKRQHQNKNLENKKE